MNDNEIITLYRSRSETAITETENAYGRYLFAIAIRILGNREDAEESVSSTYLKAWNSIPRESPDPLKTFLGGITRQISINRMEENRAAKRGGGQYALALDEMNECLSDPVDGRNFCDRIALKNLINAFLRTLSPDARIVFLKRYYYMYAVSDIAKELHMSESKVKMLLLRSRMKLKKQLKEGDFYYE